MWTNLSNFKMVVTMNKNGQNIFFLFNVFYVDKSMYFKANLKLEISNCELECLNKIEDLKVVF